MNYIVTKRKLAENVYKIDIKTSISLSEYTPGLYVKIKVEANDKPANLVVMATDVLKGEVSLLVHAIGATRQKLASLSVGDMLVEMKGPFGEPIGATNVGTVVCAAGGVGIVPIMPIVKAMKQAGNKVIVVLGASSARYILLDDEMGRFADELIIMTDDGSRGHEGMVTDALRMVFNRDKINKVITSGPIKMIKHTGALTHMYSIPLIANLHAMNETGTEPEGIFRVSVCPNSKSICVDGVDFNAFYPNFEIMIKSMEQRLCNDYEGNQSYQLLKNKQELTS